MGEKDDGADADMPATTKEPILETPKKPDVDATPFQWCQTGERLDLWALSQKPWNAQAWEAIRQAKDKEASKLGKSASFNKADLNALIIAKHLYSKDTLLAYVQEHLEEGFEPGPVLRALLSGQCCQDYVHERGQRPFHMFDAL